MQSAIRDSGQFSAQRKISLYSDFRHLRETNSVGFDANVSAWKEVIFKCVENGGFHHRTILCTGSGVKADNSYRGLTPEVARDPQNGEPLALDAVIDELVARGDLVVYSEYMRDGFYLPDSPSRPWSLWGSVSVSGALGWAAQKTGLLSPERAGKFDKARQAYDLRSQQYVVPELVKHRAHRVLRELELEAQTGQIQHVHQYGSSPVFHTRMFERIIKTCDPELSSQDTKVILVFLSRDRGLVCVDAERHTIKLTSPGIQSPISDQDVAVAELCEAIHHQTERVKALSAKFDRETNTLNSALKAKNRILAKAALRSRRATEEAQTTALQLLENVELVMLKIGQAHSQADTVAALESGARILKDLNSTLDVEKARSVMDRVREQVDEVDDVRRAMESESELDRQQEEQELELELKQLEKENKEPSRSNSQTQTETKPEVEIDVLAARLERLGIPNSSPTARDSKAQPHTERQREYAS